MNTAENIENRGSTAPQTAPSVDNNCNTKIVNIHNNINTDSPKKLKIEEKGKGYSQASLDYILLS